MCFFSYLFFNIEHEIALAVFHTIAIFKKKNHIRKRFAMAAGCITIRHLIIATKERYGEESPFHFMQQPEYIING